jgi:hypothetical protein
MDGSILPLLIALAALLALDLAAPRWGRNSRRGSDPSRDWS